MSSADRPPVCRWVRNSVQATCTYTSPPQARPGVSSTCTTLACCSSQRTRSMNGPNRAAATPRTPATNPTEQPTPSVSESSLAARPTGTWLAQVRFAACAHTPGPYCTRPPTPTGACPMVVVPQTGQTRAWTRYSVTSGRGGGGGTSNTCRLLGVHRHPGQVLPTPAAPVGGTHDRVVGISHLRQGGPWLAGLLAGLAPRPAPQRPALRLAGLLGVGAVGAGRLAGVGGVPARLPFQPHDPIAQDHHLRPQLRDLRVGRRHLRPQLDDLRVPCRQLSLVQLGLGSNHPPQLGVDRTLTPQRRAQLFNRQGGQFARRLGHARHDRHARTRRSTRPAHGIPSSCPRSPDRVHPR